jgi:hypothetical protein
VFERAASLATQGGKGYDAGIQKSISDTKAATDKLADASLEQMAATLQIQSPSKKFAKLGKHSAEGYALGFSREMDGVFDTPGMFSLRGNDQTATPLPGGGGAARGGVITIAPEVHVHFDGSRASSDQSAGQATAEAVRDRVTDLLSSIDLLAISSGAA